MRVLEQPVALERYAFVLARGRDEPLRELNHALQALDREGRIGELRARFGADRDDSWPVRINPGR